MQDAQTLCKMNVFQRKLNIDTQWNEMNTHAFRTMEDKNTESNKNH